MQTTNGQPRISQRANHLKAHQQRTKSQPSHYQKPAKTPAGNDKPMKQHTKSQPRADQMPAKTQRRSNKKPTKSRPSDNQDPTSSQTEANQDPRSMPKNRIMQHAILKHLTKKTINTCPTWTIVKTRSTCHEQNVSRAMKKLKQTWHEAASLKQCRTKKTCHETNVSTNNASTSWPTKQTNSHVTMQTCHEELQKAKQTYYEAQRSWKIKLQNDHII